jgi:hypothetical protein
VNQIVLHQLAPQQRRRGEVKERPNVSVIPPNEHSASNGIASIARAKNSVKIEDGHFQIECGLSCDIHLGLERYRARTGLFWVVKQTRIQFGPTFRIVFHDCNIYSIGMKFTEQFNERVVWKYWILDAGLENLG